MEKNANEENKTQSVALHLETLTASYDKLLKEYNQMQADYIDYLNKADKNKKKEFHNIKGQAFWGKNKAADEIMTNNVDECRALCAENKKCTGATFDSSENRNVCYLRTGMGSTVPATDKIYAIISKKMLFLSKMSYLNSKLEEINKEILDLVKEKADPEYELATTERKQNQEYLQSNYDKLKTLQDETERELAEHKRLQSEGDSGSIQVNSNYLMFVIMFIIAIIALILLVKFSIPSATSATPVQVGGSILIGRIFKKNKYYIMSMMLLLISSIFFAYKYK